MTFCDGWFPALDLDDRADTTEEKSVAELTRHPGRHLLPRAVRDPDAPDVELVQSRNCLRDLCLRDGTQVGSAHNGMEAGGARLLADVGENVDETGVGATEDDEHAVCGVDYHRLVI